MSKERSVSHGRRLKHFRKSDLEVTDEVQNHMDYQQGEILVVESFDEIRAKGPTGMSCEVERLH